MPERTPTAPSNRARSRASYEKYTEINYVPEIRDRFRLALVYAEKVLLHLGPDEVSGRGFARSRSAGDVGAAPRPLGAEAVRLVGSHSGGNMTPDTATFARSSRTIVPMKRPGPGSMSA